MRRLECVSLLRIFPSVTYIWRDKTPYLCLSGSGASKAKASTIGERLSRRHFLLCETLLEEAKRASDLACGTACYGCTNAATTGHSQLALFRQRWTQDLIRGHTRRRTLACEVCCVNSCLCDGVHLPHQLCHPEKYTRPQAQAELMTLWG